LLVAESDRSERGAWEHPFAEGEVPKEMLKEISESYDKG
jgi:hypothetical protein